MKTPPWQTSPPWRLLDLSKWPLPNGIRIHDTGIYHTINIDAATLPVPPFILQIFRWMDEEPRDIALSLGRLEREALTLLSCSPDSALAALAKQTLERHDAQLVEERRTPPLPALLEDLAAHATDEQFLNVLRRLDRDAERRPILDAGTLTRIAAHPSQGWEPGLGFARETRARIAATEDRLLALVWLHDKELSPLVQDARLLLVHVYRLRTRLCANANGVNIAQAALQVGLLAERIKVRPHEPFAKKGRKQAEDGRRNHEKAHGTQEQKQQRWQAYQQKVDDLAQQSPQKRPWAIYCQVAKHFNVSAKTIQRNTRHPLGCRKK